MERIPVHNSNVIVVNGEARCYPPASPPTPAESPPVSVCGRTGPSELEEVEEQQEEQRRPSFGHPAPPLLERRMLDGVHMLRTQAEALTKVAALYDTHSDCQLGFSQAVGAIVGTRTHPRRRDKLVVCGVGKSGHVGRKLVATCQSLGIPAAFLHPTEALHGDLGLVGSHDAFLFVTNSGKTPELLLLLPHLPASVQVIVLTTCMEPGACELLRRRPDGILLPAPIHMSEEESFGVAAPTTSTTVALAVGDALAMAVAREIYHHDIPDVFARNHPGGSIGADLARRGYGS